MKALVTGFEPFGGDTVNPSREAVLLLPPRLGDIEVATRVLPTVFDAALAALEDALAATRPDIVLCTGLADGRAGLSLERVAINIADARIADNAGRQPIDGPVVRGGPAAYFSTLPIKAATMALCEAGLPATVSNTAGTFVCNQVFYALMHLTAARGLALRGGFLHLPCLPSQAARHSLLGESMPPSMALADIVRGIEIVLAVAATVREDIAVAAGAIS